MLENPKTVLTIRIKKHFLTTQKMGKYFSISEMQVSYWLKARCKIHALRSIALGCCFTYLYGLELKGLIPGGKTHGIPFTFFTSDSLQAGKIHTTNTPKEEL